ncbi:MAG: hypothetical protein C0P66_009610, partial [Bacillaceae bacterium]
MKAPVGLFGPAGVDAPGDGNIIGDRGDRKGIFSRPGNTSYFPRFASVKERENIHPSVSEGWMFDLRERPLTGSLPLSDDFGLYPGRSAFIGPIGCSYLKSVIDYYWRKREKCFEITFQFILYLYKLGLVFADEFQDSFIKGKQVVFQLRRFFYLVKAQLFDKFGICHFKGTKFSASFSSFSF